MLDGTTRLTCKGKSLKQLARLGTFSEYIVVPEMLVVKPVGLNLVSIDLFQKTSWLFKTTHDKLKHFQPLVTGYTFKFKFKFIYSHLFNYNTTTIREKKRSKNRANYTLN